MSSPSAVPFLAAPPQPPSHPSRHRAGASSRARSREDAREGTTRAEDGGGRASFDGATTSNREEKAFAWATLDAFGVLGRAGRTIDESGGPVAWMRKDPLALWALREESRVRPTAGPALPIADDARRIEIRARDCGGAEKGGQHCGPFLEGGGEVLGRTCGWSAA